MAYVSTAGSSIAPFDSPERAAQAIQAAIDVVHDGDTVFVLPGIYTGPGNRDISFRGSRILVQSLDPESLATIDVQASFDDQARAVTFSANEDSLARLIGFVLQGGALWPNSRLPSGGAILCSAASPTIARCTFRGNFAFQGGALSCEQMSAPQVISCLFEGNSATRGGGAVFIDSASSPQFEACSFLQNSSDIGGAAYHRFETTSRYLACTFVDNTAVEGGGAVFLGASSPEFANCTFCSNTTFGFGGAISAAAAYPIFNRCIIAFSDAGASIDCPYSPDCSSSVARPLLFCCDVFGNIGGDWTAVIADQEFMNGNLTVDPVFCDIASGDLHLRPESPCVSSNNSCLQLIGALDADCSSSGTRDDSDSQENCHTVLMRCNPNPFNSNVQVQIVLREPCWGRLEVANILGQRVATLFEGPIDSGKRQLRWNATNYAGLGVPSGIYLVMFSGGGMTAVDLITFVK